MLSNIILSVATLIVVVAITPVFQYLPQSALSAIIVVAVIGLVRRKAEARPRENQGETWHITF